MLPTHRTFGPRLNFSGATFIRMRPYVIMRIYRLDSFALRFGSVSEMKRCRGMVATVFFF